MNNIETYENKDIKQMCDALLEYQNELHEQNQRRIKYGLRCVFIIPGIFLFLMMLSGAVGTSKIVFLVMWVGSLFGISTYLIMVEYADYKLQTRINSIKGEESTPVKELVGGPLK